MLIYIANFVFPANRFVSAGISRVDDRTDSEKKENPNKAIGECPLYIKLFVKVTDTNANCVHFKEDKGPVELVDTYISLLDQLSNGLSFRDEPCVRPPEGYRQSLLDQFNLSEA